MDYLVEVGLQNSMVDIWLPYRQQEDLNEKLMAKQKILSNQKILEEYLTDETKRSEKRINGDISEKTRAKAETKME